MYGSSYVYIPSRTSNISNIENDDKYWFIRSIQAYLQPIANAKNGHPTRDSILRQKFGEINIQGFDHSTGFKCSDVNDFEKFIKLSIKTVELSFCRD